MASTGSDVVGAVAHQAYAVQGQPLSVMLSMPCPKKEYCFQAAGGQQYEQWCFNQASWQGS
jgi:hypothetical protein